MLSREHRLLPHAPCGTYAANLSAVGSSSVGQARREPPEAVLQRLQRSGLLPKRVDFDELTRTFTYDERQPLKRPDWTTPELPRELHRDEFGASS